MKYVFIKIFYFFINPFRKAYFFIFRPNTNGVKCLVENDEKFLLVKLNYAHRLWTTPGGRVDKKESFLQAAIREAKEETGVDVSNLIFIGSYESSKQYKRGFVEVYLGSSAKIDIKIDPIEIKEARWFNRNEIPENRSSSVDKVFNFYDEYKSKTN